MSHANTAQVFTYATQRGSYLSTVGAFLFLSLAEGSLIVFLVLHFVPGTIWQTLILALIGLFVTTMFGRLLLPLWTRHRVSSTDLELRYGLEFHARIPREILVSARPVQEKMGPLAGPRYNAAKGYFSLAFATSGQALLRLEKPLSFRFGLRGACTTDQLLISVDQRDAFLAALALPDRAESITAQTRTPVPRKQRAEPVQPLVSLTYHTANQKEIAAPVVQGIQPRADEANAGEASVPIALRTEGLTRRYANFTAVEQLNLAVRRGEIYGFLGANGAGKSTTVRMLVGLLQPTSGRAWLANHDVWREPSQAKEELGYVADRALLYDRLTGREFLAFLAQLRGLPRDLADRRVAELLELLELAGQAERSCGSYSFGMKRKLSLAGALLHRPPVLILDEPLNGLDPLSARRLKDLFLRLSAEGTTIFLSTHDLSTAEAICHRVGIIQQGRLLAEGSAQELRSPAAAPDLESVFLALTAQPEEITV